MSITLQSISHFLFHRKQFGEKTQPRTCSRVSLAGSTGIGLCSVSLGGRTGQEKGSCKSQHGRFQGDTSQLFLKAERPWTVTSR